MYKTLRLIDLVDGNNYEALYNVLTANLVKFKTAGVYPVNDNGLFANFIERLCDRYYNRYINFDTYKNFEIKLKFVLENNKAKYLRIYECSLKEIEPLLTFSEDEKITSTGDDTKTGGSNSESSGENKSNYESGNDSTQDVTEKPDITNTHTTTNSKQLTGHSSTPKSNKDFNKNLSELEYLDSESLQYNINNYTDRESGKSETHTVNTSTETGSNNSTNSSTSKSDYNDAGHSESIVNRIKSGFNGSQVDLIEKYLKLVFDMNNEIIKDIDNAGLFMNMLY